MARVNRWLNPSHRKQARDFIEAGVKRMKREAFKAGPEERLNLLRELAQTRVPFRWATGRRKAKRIAFEKMKRWKGPRWRLNRSCFICASPENIHFHHVYPLFQGGMNIEANLLPLCAGCHTRVHEEVERPEFTGYRLGAFGAIV